MGAIVGGVILFILGAIVSFALDISIPFMDANVLGYILMGGGLVLFIVGLVAMTSARRTVVENRTNPRGTVHERRDY